MPEACSGCRWPGSGCPAPWTFSSAPWFVLVPPFCPAAPGYGNSLPRLVLPQQCVLFQGHFVFLNTIFSNRIISSLKKLRSIASFRKSCFFFQKSVCSNSVRNAKKNAGRAARQRFAGKSPQLKSFFSSPGNFRELHGFCPEGSNRVMQHFVIFLKEIRPCSDRFIQKLHVYEKLCLLRKLFCPLKIPFVETAQKKSQILVDLFSCRPLRRRL